MSYAFTNTVTLWWCCTWCHTNFHIQLLFFLSTNQTWHYLMTVFVKM